MFLENINNPKDLKKLSLEQLPQLAQEIRQRILEVVSHTGGHLASSLGAVELAISLHYCLNTPEDKILWDVGHQSYAHKLLTGRNKNFDSLRQFQGISGFCSKDESEFDTFTSGHSSNAISQALGLVCARDLISQKGFKVAAVIGDGALSGGLCFEGLNNVGHLKKDMLVILNTNELSIAPNVGALSTYLNKIISLPIYNRFRNSLEGFIKSAMPKRGKRLLGLANKFEEGLKGLFIPGLFFEELGFRYFGPFDGHDLATLIPTLKNILTLKGPILLHVVTKKGKGYLPAEKDPVRFHGTGPFDIASGKPNVKGNIRKSYTEIFSEEMVRLAKQNPRIAAITAAMPEGTGLDKFRDLYPQRFFDVGIAEAHAVCFSAGLAAAGLKPVVALYSTFLQRGYDQIIEEVALQNLPVIFAVDRAGIVGEDGITHQGIFDIAYLRNIPNLVAMAPKNGSELCQMLEFALGLDCPVSIRYPRDQVPLEAAGEGQAKIELGLPELLIDGKDVAIVALGSMVDIGYQAVELLKQKGLSPKLINARFIQPFDIKFLLGLLNGIDNIYVLEEGIIEGGFGSSLMEKFNKHKINNLKINLIGLPEEFIAQGKRSLLLSRYGLEAQAIAKKILEAK